MAFNGSPAGYNPYPISCLDSATDNKSYLYGGFKIASADDNTRAFIDKNHLFFNTTESIGAQFLIQDGSGIGIGMLSQSGAGQLYGGGGGLKISSFVEGSVTDAMVIDASGNLTISALTNATQAVTAPQYVSKNGSVVSNLYPDALNFTTTGETGLSISTSSGGVSFTTTKASGEFDINTTGTLPLKLGNTAGVTSSDLKTSKLAVGYIGGADILTVTPVSTKATIETYNGLILSQKIADVSTQLLHTDVSGNFLLDGTSSMTFGATNALISSGTVDFTAGTVTVPTVAQTVNDNTAASTSYVHSAISGVAFDVNAQHTWGAVQTFSYPLQISWSRSYGGTGYLGYNTNVTTYDITADGINCGAFIVNHGIYSVFTNLTCTILAGSSISSIISTIRTGSRTGAILNNSVNIYPVVISGNTQDINISIGNSTCGYLGSDLYCVVSFTVPSGNYQDSLSNIAVNTSFTRVS